MSEQGLKKYKTHDLAIRGSFNLLFDQGANYVICTLHNLTSFDLSLGYLLILVQGLIVEFPVG